MKTRQKPEILRVLPGEQSTHEKLHRLADQYRPKAAEVYEETSQCNVKGGNPVRMAQAAIQGNRR